ncbi:MAG: hypothetical protein HFE85_02715 [Clostridiales bacterium]|nr:hypothetical protein [Clostridiales bacterium]
MKKFKKALAVLLSACIAGSAAASGTAFAADSGGSDFLSDLKASYTDPAREYKSEVRWWMAEGAHTDETLLEELQTMYDAGFRGVELCQLDVGGLDGGSFGYGSDQWNHDFHLVLNKALDMGMTVGLTAGTNWQTANVPGLDPDSQAANQSVFETHETVEPGASRSGTIPTNQYLRPKANFIGAYAYRKMYRQADIINREVRILQNRENPSDPSTFTIDLDFIIDSETAGFGFGGRDNKNFIMWQVNAQSPDMVRLRPHTQVNGGWSSAEYNITKAIGYTGSEIIGQKVHMKIEVKDGKTVDTYFDGSDTSVATWTIPDNAAKNANGEFTLGKLMFRHMNDVNSDEVTRYDNIVVRDENGNVIFEETFDDPENTGFQADPFVEVVDGMLKVGKKQVGNLNTIDSNNIIDLTGQVVLNADNRTGTLNWTAPDDGEYLIMYYWQQGAAQRSYPAVQASYCINYFDERGLDALKAYWEANVFNDPTLNAKIKAGDVQLFMDSLEWSYGDGFNFYPEAFAEEFQARKGYDIRPYLIILCGLPGHLVTFDPPPAVQGTYPLEDAELSQRIFNDFFDVQTELYMEKLMNPFREWLNSHGVALRAQISYGKYPEISEPILSVDYPEAENLNQRNQPDIYRLWSGGGHLENKILSSETSANFYYQNAYDFQKHLLEAYSLFASGFSRMNWHVWTSQWAPTSVNVSWPGFTSLEICNVFGSTRYPFTEDYDEFNNHLGRVQQLLREGKARVDIGMPYLKYGQPVCFSSAQGEFLRLHHYMIYPSTELQDNGYSYDYFSPEFFKSERVYYDAENGTLELAGYKALVLFQEWLSIEGAQAILDYTKQGMKAVVIDGAAVQTPYRDGSDEQLAAIMSEIKAQPSVKTVASADDVYEALQELGVDPYAKVEENHQLMTQTRQNGDDKYLYVYNYCDASLCGEDHGDHIQTEIAMEGISIPYQIDAWSGEVTELSNYRYENGRTVIPLDLDYNDIRLYAFEAVDGEKLHVTSTNADSAYMDKDQAIIRATKSGDYTAQLSNGETVARSIEVPAAYDITGWDLTVESWTAGEEIFRIERMLGRLITEHTYDTNKTNIDVKLDTLTTWDNIPEVGRNVSGKGYYSATFNWDGSADGAYIDFGSLLQSMTVFINGKKTSDINVNNPIVDISDLLVVGENTIEITYNSTLTNVLLSTGRISVRNPGGGFGTELWPGYEVNYRSYGPAQAIIIPYVEKRVGGAVNASVKAVDAQGAAITQVTANELFSVTAVTSSDVQQIALFNEYGLRMGLKEVKKTDNGDGTATWSAKTSIGTAGAGRTITLGVLMNGEYVKTDASFRLDIAAVKAVVVSASIEETATVNEPVTLTVVTNTAASRIHVYNEYGLKMGTQSQSYMDVDGERIWTVTMAIGTKGVRAFAVSAQNRTGDMSEAVVTNQITVGTAA